MQHTISSSVPSLWQRLAAPVFADDEDKTRVARLLNTISLSLLGVAVLGAIVILPAGWSLENVLIVGATTALLVLV